MNRIGGWATALIALMAVSNVASAALPLGQVSVTQGDCRSGSCTVNVLCNGSDKQATLRIKTPSSGTASNTVVFFLGGPGTVYWGDASTYAGVTVDTLVQEGFRTVEVAWLNGNWATGSNTGPATQACRPASIINYVYTSFDVGGMGGFLHATGNSAGSAQVAYSLSHYGLESVLTSAVLTGGPPYARIDLGCFNVAGDPLVFGNEDARITIDQTFGFSKDGPCKRRDAAYASTYAAGSVVYEGNDYHYPNTIAHFIFGTADTSNSDEQGMQYVQRLLTEKTPYLAVQYIAGMPHELPKSQDGTLAVLNALRAYKR